MCFIEHPPKVLGCRTFEEDVIEGCEALTIFTHRMIFKCLFVLDNMIQVLPQEGHSCIIWNASGNPPHLRIPWGLSGFCGKASCEMDAVVMILTGVWENEYRSYGLERIAQLHFSEKLPNE